MGKTALIRRFVDGQFSVSHKATTGADFHCKDIRVTTSNGTEVIAKMQLWDTAGQEKFSPTLGTTFYRGADAVIFVFDVTDTFTLESL